MKAGKRTSRNIGLPTTARDRFESGALTRVSRAQDSPVAGGARGFARGQIFDRAGNLVASVAQEGLVRRIGD